MQVLVVKYVSWALPINSPTLTPLLVLKQKLRDKSNHEHNILRYMAYIRVIPTHSLYKWDLWRLANMFSWVVEKQNSSQNKVIVPISHLSNLEFWKFFSRKSIVHFYSSKGTLKSLNGVYVTTKAYQCFAFFLFLLLLKMFMWSFRQG
jgi:hypothetical protein